MKALLLSIKPEHAINILRGKKTLELRKSVPKGFKGWVYVYVTKGERLSVVHDDENGKTYYYLNSHWGRSLNQDVPFRFWFDEYEMLNYKDKIKDYSYINMQLSEMKKFISDLCLTYDDVKTYGNGKDLYAWHIKQLEIFDDPKELGEFYREEYAVMPNGIFPAYQPLTHAPQKYVYCYTKEE